MTTIRPSGGEHPAYSVLGILAPSKLTVSHCGVLLSKASLGDVSCLDVLHCAPPLSIGQRWPSELDIVGIIDLSETEVIKLNGIREEFREQLKDREWSVSEVIQNYTLIPAYVLDTDPVTGVERERFSCAGLVQEFFRRADKALTLVDEANLPLIERSRLEYLLGADFVRKAIAISRVHNPEVDERGPWPVLLPAYLFRALRSTSRPTLPYRPMDVERDSTEIWSDSASESQV